MTTLIMFQHYYHYQLRMWRCNASVASVCASVCPVLALTLERFDLETSFLVSRYVFRTPIDIGRVSRSWGQGQGRMNVNKYTHSWVVFISLKRHLVTFSFTLYNDLAVS